MRLNPNDIVIAEEPDLKGESQELLAEFVSTQTFTLQIGEGLRARSHTVELRPFTLIVTTSKPWQFPTSFRRWFVPLDFVPYSRSEIAQILSTCALGLGLRLDAEAAELFAEHCQGTPGGAAALLTRIQRHYASVTSASPINRETAEMLLDLLGLVRSDQPIVTLADRLRGMSGVEFEQFVADLFKSLGYSAEFTATSGDHGIDLLLRKSGELSAVQCKRWSDSVGEPVLRDFL